VVATLDTWFPPDLAESWDSVGLILGDPDAQVASALVAVDPTAAVVAEAIDRGVDLLVTHHPLWLTPVTSLSGAKGRIAHGLVRAGVGLYNAHTNADRAVHGVNDALASALGLQATEPMEQVTASMLRLTVYVPAPDRQRLIDALAAAGAGAIGNYDHCAYTTAGSGTFRPLTGADPHIGTVGQIEHVAEDRLEMVLPHHCRRPVMQALLATHPYEEPAYDFTAIEQVRRAVGLGRVGTVEPTTLWDFAAHVSRALPVTAAGVRFAGDPGLAVERVAVVGGSGGSELGTASGVADVLVTADLKHHTVDEHLADGGCAVIDVAHWASEWPWCPLTAGRLRDLGLLAGASELVTDPWTGRM
jgi:dinuclear metal center YbgI/SA1388 family protein